MDQFVGDSRKETPDSGGRPGPKVGIALGAGGAKGVAHVPMLEALDELGITPHCIAGCSIGAVMGALYASGLSALDIRDTLDRFAYTPSDTMRSLLSDRKINRWIGLIDPSFGSSGLVKSESIMASLCQDRSCDSFDDLVIPFKVVATDFWEGRTVVIESGPLKPAVQASMALPGLFPPVELDGRVLIDGGTANPVPYDVLSDSCDVLVAVDINSGSSAEPGSIPGYFNTVFGSIQIMQQAIVDQKLKSRPPDIYIKPDLSDFRTLHYHRAEEIYEQAESAKIELKRQLAEKVEAWNVQQG